MKQSAHRYFQMGMIAAMAYPSLAKAPLSEMETLLKKIACDSFYDVIELPPPRDTQVRDLWMKLLGQSHMKVCYSAHGKLFAGGLNPNALPEEQRQQAQQALIEAVDEAALMGCQEISFLSRGWTPQTQEAQVDALVKTTVSVCRHAAEKGMSVELELFDSDIDKKSLLGPASLAARFAAKVRSQCGNFGFMVDLSHFPMCREESRYILRTLRPYIVHLHYGNTVIASPELPAYGDEHPRFGFPNSENELPELLTYLRALKEEGFFNPQTPMVLSSEVKPWGEEDPDIVLAGTKRVFNRAWALLED